MFLQKLCIWKNSASVKLVFTTTDNTWLLFWFARGSGNSICSSSVLMIDRLTCGIFGDMDDVGIIVRIARINASRSYNCFLRWVLILSRNCTGGVELITRSVARMAGRQHSKKHSHNTVLLNENRDPWEKVPCHSGSYSSKCYSQIPISRQYWGICATPFENFRRSNDSKWCQRSKSVNSIQSIDEIRVARISRFPAWFREMRNGEEKTKDHSVHRLR